MLGGAFFLHIFAGHLTNVDALTWMPLLLLAVDGLLENTSAAGRVRRDETMWVLLGALAVAMQLLAGRWEVHGVDLDAADSPLLQ